MKHSVFFSVVFAFLISLSPEVRSQIKINLKEKINQEANRRANRATDKSVDAGFDKVEQGVRNIFEKKDKNEKNGANSGDVADEEEKDTLTADQPAEGKESKETSPALSWSKYDFVPGDQVIFEDNLQNEENGDLNFSVEGHTDSQGDDAFNMKLSQEHAESVKNTLIIMGISPDRLTAKGWGESKPISDNASPEDMANNRRVEFVKI